MRVQKCKRCGTTNCTYLKLFDYYYCCLCIKACKSCSKLQKEKEEKINQRNEELKDLLMTIYTELQDVKVNTEDNELLQDLLQHMDSELITAAKIVAALKKKEDQKQ